MALAASVGSSGSSGSCGFCGFCPSSPLLPGGSVLVGLGTGASVGGGTGASAGGSGKSDAAAQPSGTASPTVVRSISSVVRSSSSVQPTVGDYQRRTVFGICRASEVDGAAPVNVMLTLIVIVSARRITHSVGFSPDNAKSLPVMPNRIARDGAPTPFRLTARV